MSVVVLRDSIYESLTQHNWFGRWLRLHYFDNDSTPGVWGSDDATNLLSKVAAEFNAKLWVDFENLQFVMEFETNADYLQAMLME